MSQQAQSCTCVSETARHVQHAPLDDCILDPLHTSTNYMCRARRHRYKLNVRGNIIRNKIDRQHRFTCVGSSIRIFHSSENRFGSSRNSYCPVMYRAYVGARRTLAIHLFTDAGALGTSACILGRGEVCSKWAQCHIFDRKVREPMREMVIRLVLFWNP